MFENINYKTRALHFNNFETQTNCENFEDVIIWFLILKSPLNDPWIFYRLSDRIRFLLVMSSFALRIEIKWTVSCLTTPCLSLSFFLFLSLALSLAHSLSLSHSRSLSRRKLKICFDFFDLFIRNSLQTFPCRKLNWGKQLGRIFSPSKQQPDQF